jgi:hypothetical protein
MVTGHTYKHVSFAEFVPHYPANSRTSLLGLAILCLVFCAFCLAALAQPGKVSAVAAGAQHSLFLETNGTLGDPAETAWDSWVMAARGTDASRCASTRVSPLWPQALITPSF